MKLSAARGPFALAALLALSCHAALAQTPSPPGGDTSSPADSATLTVRAQPVTESFPAYGQIQPVAVAQVNAVEAGVVRRLPLPGERVTAGQVLAVLGGAQAQSLLAARRDALRVASMQLAADRRKLAAQLVTRQTVAADESAYQAARGQLQVAQQTLTLRAPADGQVLAVAAADGERVAAGQLLLTLQTSSPWLIAAYYGADALAIHPGMAGRFQPAAGGEIPVRVRTVSQSLGPDGGEQVGMSPALPPRQDPAALAQSWRSGAWGTVTLTGPTRYLVAVPTRALILDQARWWVLVRTPQGIHRQAVIPGQVRGWETFIEQGLSPGQRIVVENAYLEFHRGISQRYTPPD